MIDRRRMLTLTALVPLAGALPETGAATTLGDDGLHKQPWFLDSFLDMGDDLAEAAAEGRGLIVLFEQRGCPYCRELHEVNFADDRITGYMQEHFTTVQLDLWGAREVTDFDGETLEERDLAGKWRVNFTPTVVIFPASAAGTDSAAEAEAFRMPGYFKPFHFLSGLEYVAGGHAGTQPFQRFLQDKFADLEARGIKPDVW